MARKAMIEIDCARCGIKEYQEAPDGKPAEKDTVDLVVTFLGVTHQFDDLCSRCKATCKNYVESMVRDVKANKKSKGRRRSPAKGPSPENLPTRTTPVA
jgi:hypothetical protein